MEYTLAPCPIFRDHLRRFRDQVRPYIDLVLDNELEWLVLGQHHGLPSRLLDWTRSPLVAAYFAATKIEDKVVFNGNKPKKIPIDGGIYAVRRPPKVGPSDRKKPFEIDRVKLIGPPHISERVARQVSVLTIHPTPENPWQPGGAVQYIIPRGDKLAMKYELDRLGINEASLFPGVDAAARYLRWQLKWDRLT